jgi:hypothetical protein
VDERRDAARSGRSDPGGAGSVRRRFAKPPHDLAEEDRGQAADAFVGLFADQPDLIEEVCEAAMQARETDPLRLIGG